MAIWLPELPDIQLEQGYPPPAVAGDLLDQLADREEPVHQHGPLAPDLPVHRPSAEGSRRLKRNPVPRAPRRGAQLDSVGRPLARSPHLR